MNKRIFIAFLFIALIILIVIYAVNNNLDKTIPNFKFFTLDNKEFSINDIENGHSVFIYINTECKLCEYELSRLQITQDSISNYDIYIISNSDYFEYIELIKRYDIDKISNTMLLYDRDLTFESTFNTKVTPSSFIYNNGKLVKYFNGSTDLDFFFDYLIKHNCD